ncbi:MAG: PrgI family protein [Actinomadura sp.]
MGTGIDDEPLVAKIPADVDRPDKILYGLTARQLAVLAVTGLLASSAYLLAAGHLPLPAIVTIIVPIVAAGSALAVGSRDGMSLDRFTFSALRYLRGSKTQVLTTENVQPPPAWYRQRGRLPAPLRLPVRAVRDDGVLELAEGGTAVIVRAGTVSFGLRTPAEQAGLVAAFGRWLNSLEAPAQILMHTRPVDLSGLAQKVTRSAPQLADPALEQAALDHAAFLTSLSNDYDLLARQILIVVRDEPSDRHQAIGLPWARRRHRTTIRDVSAEVVVRRAEEAVRSLGVLGITASVLTGPEAVGLLAESLSPGEHRLPGLAAPGETITAPSIKMEATR